MKLLFSILAAMAVASGCTTTVTTTPTPGATCTDYQDCPKYNGKIQSCCTATTCEYRANAQVYACNGKDCASASTTVVAYCAK